MSEITIQTTAGSRRERIFEKIKVGAFAALWFGLVKEIQKLEVDDETFNFYSVKKVGIAELGGVRNYLSTYLRTAISQIFV